MTLVFRQPRRGTWLEVLAHDALALGPRALGNRLEVGLDADGAVLRVVLILAEILRRGSTDRTSACMRARAGEGGESMARALYLSIALSARNCTSLRARSGRSPRYFFITAAPS